MEEEIIISLLHNNHFKRDKPPNLFHYRLPNYTPVLCWDVHWRSEWGWMVGLGMLGASRLSSIWAGRCAKEKTTTQRARSPSGDQFMVLALSLPVKKQISWCVFKRLGKHQEEIFSLFSFLPLVFLLSSFFAIYWAIFSQRWQLWDGSANVSVSSHTHAPLHLRHTNIRLV